MVNGPSNHVVTVVAILKGESKTAFNAVLEDARVDPNDNRAELPLHTDHIETALRVVTILLFFLIVCWRFRSCGCNVS